MPRKTGESYNISVRISEDMAKKIEEIRAEQPYNIPKSEIVRQALREHVERRDNDD